MVSLATGTDTVLMDKHRDSGAQDPAEGVVGDGADTDTWMDVNGIMVIPATGTTITAEMVRRMIDEDRERYVMDRACER